MKKTFAIILFVVTAVIVYFSYYSYKYTTALPDTGSYFIIGESDTKFTTGQSSRIVFISLNNNPDFFDRIYVRPDQGMLYRLGDIVFVDHIGGLKKVNAAPRGP